jgi:hypothetical protein
MIICLWLAVCGQILCMHQVNIKWDNLGQFRMYKLNSVTFFIQETMFCFFS